MELRKELNCPYDLDVVSKEDLISVIANLYPFTIFSSDASEKEMILERWLDLCNHYCEFHNEIEDLAFNITMS